MLGYFYRELTVTAACVCVCVIVWRVGDAADCFRDPHPGASSSADVQHSTAPQGPGGSSLPARLPGASGETCSTWTNTCNTFHCVNSKILN